jgi:hypothetical protein
MAQAWADHADQPEAVARRLQTLTPAPTTPTQIGALVRLVVHLLGEHLGRFDDAQWRLNALAGHALAQDGVAAAELRVGRAALNLARNLPSASLAPAESVRALAAAAALCVGRGQSERALELLVRARQQLADLPDANPADHKPLAVACNNMAWTLHDLGAARRSTADTAAMLDIAAASRVHWSRAGTWLEVQRADYCLALDHLSAGRADDALHHAVQCLSACIGHDAAPFEHVYGHEAIARVQHARGDATARDHHVAAAKVAFERLAADDQAACRSTLDALHALGKAA